MNPFLIVNNVSHSYHSSSGETITLRDICFSMSEGEFIAIVGPSGCGKSTLLSLISGLLSCSSGEILLEGSPILEKRTSIGYMLQKDHLFPWRTTGQNILLGPEVTHNLSETARIKAQEYLNLYGLSQFENSHPKELSGGMRQRTALIRTLMTEPKLLLLDEPFSALDYQTRLKVSDDICKLIRKEHITAILVTHDISEAISVADRVIVLTPRPATISSIYSIRLELDAPLHSPLAARSSPNFTKYFNLIWKELTSK